MTPIRSSRPLWLKLLVWALLFLSLLGWLRLAESLARWDLLLAVGARPGPLYTAASGLLIGTLALVSAIGLWLRAVWAPGFTRAFVALWLLWLWLDRWLVASSPDALANWPFLLGSSVLILAIVFLALSLGRDQF